MSWLDTWLYGKPRKKRMTKKRKGKSAYRKGKIGETKVKKYLSRRGVRTIKGTERMRTSAGEYDYIGRDRANRRVVVEAKFRKSPVSSSDVRKLKRKMSRDGLKRGVIVSKGGVTTKAKRAAKRAGIKIMPYKPPQRKKQDFLTWLLG